MKEKLLHLLRFSLESLGVAGICYILLQTVMISRDNQDTLNEMANRINYIDQSFKSCIHDKPPVVHVRHTWHVEQWLGNSKK